MKWKTQQQKVTTMKQKNRASVKCSLTSVNMYIIRVPKGKKTGRTKIFF